MVKQTFGNLKLVFLKTVIFSYEGLVLKGRYNREPGLLLLSVTSHGVYRYYKDDSTIPEKEARFGSGVELEATPLRRELQFCAVGCACALDVGILC